MHALHLKKFTVTRRIVMFEYTHYVQFSTEELVKEVKNSIAEFDKHKQEYDEERVKEQVIEDS